jgi:uncharacterized protein (TIGR03000 family)
MHYAGCRVAHFHRFSKSVLTTQSSRFTISTLKEFQRLQNQDKSRMYSLLLMSAMAGSGDATAFNGRFLGNHFAGGCGGCRGTVVVASCHGCSGCSGCYGSGCYGSSCHGGVFGSRIWGASCYGSSCLGSSCHGCLGSSCLGSCHGCFGTSTMGVTVIEGEIITMPSTGTVKLEDQDAARIRIELPPGAKLFVDGQPVDATSGQFHTPPLPRGRTFTYDMKAEVTVNGKVIVEEKTITVKAGETTTEKFGKLTVASN